jgi:hypothetical protein
MVGLMFILAMQIVLLIIIYGIGMIILGKKGWVKKVESNANPNYVNNSGNNSSGDYPGNLASDLFNATGLVNPYNSVANAAANNTGTNDTGTNDTGTNYVPNYDPLSGMGQQGGFFEEVDRNEINPTSAPTNFDVEKLAENERLTAAAAKNGYVPGVKEYADGNLDAEMYSQFLIDTQIDPSDVQNHLKYLKETSLKSQTTSTIPRETFDTTAAIHRYGHNAFHLQAPKNYGIMVQRTEVSNEDINNSFKESKYNV